MLKGSSSRKSADFHSSDACCVPICCKVQRKSTFGKQEIFRGILKIDFKIVVFVKYMKFSGPKQNIPPYF
jgi:hypothetical protein